MLQYKVLELGLNKEMLNITKAQQELAELREEYDKVDSEIAEATLQHQLMQDAEDKEAQEEAETTMESTQADITQ